MCWGKVALNPFPLQNRNPGNGRILAILPDSKAEFNWHPRRPDRQPNLVHIIQDQFSSTGKHSRGRISGIDLLMTWARVYGVAL